VRKLLLVCLLSVSAPAFAEYSSTLTMTSNYIWRGLSFSSGGAPDAASGSPVLQGSFDYAHSSGFGLSLFAGNTDTYNFSTSTVEKDTEAEINGTYTYNLNDEVSMGLHLFWFNYLRNSSNNSVDYGGFLRWKMIRFDFSYIPDYFGTESSDTYVRLTGTHQLSEKMGLIAHLGSSSFGNESKVGYKNYLDHRLGVYYTVAPFTVETAYSDTDRKDLTNQKLNDKAVTISLSATFQ